jgi:hypothetical protein
MSVGALPQQAAAQDQRCPRILLLRGVAASVTHRARRELPLQVTHAADVGGAYRDAGGRELVVELLLVPRTVAAVGFDHQQYPVPGALRHEDPRRAPDLPGGLDLHRQHLAVAIPGPAASFQLRFESRRVHAEQRMQISRSFGRADTPRPSGHQSSRGRPFEVARRHAGLAAPERLFGLGIGGRLLVQCASGVVQVPLQPVIDCQPHGIGKRVR